MKNLLIKRWSPILVAFALTLQVITPAAFATESENNVTTDTTSETVTTSDTTNADNAGTADTSTTNATTDESAVTESTAVNVDLSGVSSDDAVEVLDDLLEEQENVDAETDAIINNLLEEANTDEEAEDLIQEVEEDVNDAIADLEAKAKANPALRAQIAKRILKHRAFLLRLRAKLIARHHKVVEKIQHIKEVRRLYEIRWGVLDPKEQKCPGLTREAIKTALDAGETPKCGIAEADYTGSISVNKGKLHVQKQMLFEKNDSVTNEGGSSVEWTSHIAGHWDGLIVEYTPGNEEGKVDVSLSIGDLNATFSPAEAMGRKPIGNGHMIEVRPLAAAISGVVDNAQDKLVENKLKIEDKISKIKDKIYRLRLLKANSTEDVADEVVELETLLQEIGDYNFDDTSNDEIGIEVDASLIDLGDGTNKERVKNRLDHLRKMFQTVKEKAKDRKFSEKLIPFKDTDDSEWYTKYVAPMKEKGIVSGYKDGAGNEIGEYRPGNNVTVAEILKIGLETSNNGQGDGVPALQAALNHWAKAYVKRAEELGLDIVGTDTDLNRPATRGEVIRMMLEAAGVDPDAVSGTSFSDVSASHKHAAFIALAKELGIVSGDDNTGTFRPDEPINRAEVAKIANQILEVLLGE
ncbi:MAG: S-layer homology domain-containing protein [Patescibacteria group bacterium]